MKLLKYFTTYYVNKPFHLLKTMGERERKQFNPSSLRGTVRHRMGTPARFESFDLLALDIQRIRCRDDTSVSI